MYKVFDDYDMDMEFIGTADNIEEVKELARERYDETDGECCIVYGRDKKQTKFLCTFESKER